MALALSHIFDFTKTYFLVAGIAGINLEVASICSVTFARFAVQVAMQYEIETRELPDNFTTGYIPFGADTPEEYPTSIYGTEVLEFNTALQNMAIEFAKKATPPNVTPSLKRSMQPISRAEMVKRRTKTGIRVGPV
jgi:purine nucleoside permease